MCPKIRTDRLPGSFRTRPKHLTGRHKSCSDIFSDRLYGRSVFFGTELLYFLLPGSAAAISGIAPKTNLSLIPTQLFYFPAGFIIGLCLITFFNYWIALLMTPFIPADMHVLYPANVVTICLFLYLGSFFWQKAICATESSAHV